MFAVALGMQQRDRRAVIRALPMIAIGHECALVLVVLLVLVLVLEVVADPSALHMGAGVALVAFGIFRFVKPRAHPRLTTMRVNGRELTWWSFLMSSAHGAGLMVAPVILGTGAGRPPRPITRSRRSTTGRCRSRPAASPSCCTWVP
ncbi:MAG TPA: hypothetical protein VH276_17845 [Solirubrobacteraceae bacterium]|nr:hypothetical protein [Solirubrobacteraceae bacterium]